MRPSRDLGDRAGVEGVEDLERDLPAATQVLDRERGTQLRGVAEHFGRDVGSAGPVDNRSDGPPERVRSNATDAGLIEDRPETTSDVVRGQRGVVAAEEDQVLRIFAGDHDESLPQHLRGEGGGSRWCAVTWRSSDGLVGRWACRSERSRCRGSRPRPIVMSVVIPIRWAERSETTGVVRDWSAVVTEIGPSKGSWKEYVESLWRAVQIFASFLNGNPRLSETGNPL